MQAKTNETLTDLFAAVEDYHWWFIGRRLLVLRAISHYVKKKKHLTFLDVGCGTGGTLKALSNLGDVYGVDVSQRCVNYCRKNGIKNVRKASATKLPFPHNMFDVVLLLDVLEHIQNEAAAVQEAKRVVKPEGIIIFTLPALPLIWSEHDTNQSHVKRYLARDLQPIAQRNGLQLIYKTYFNFFLAVPIAIIRISSRAKIFSALHKYESTVNLNIARRGITNRFLTKLFTIEIFFSQSVSYPFGISLLAVYRNTQENSASEKSIRQTKPS